MVALVTAIAVAVLTPTTGGAQGVVLEIRPHVGDTLRMRLDQQMQVTALPEGGAPVTTSTTMLLLARAVAQQAQASGTVVETIADSVAVSGTDPRGAATREETERTLIGRHVRMLVALDGSARLLDTPDGTAPGLGEIIALMPASLPRKPVNVGDNWTKTMAMPIDRDVDGSLASLHATFRLDSLSRNGDLAYVSMRGTIVRNSKHTSAAATRAEPVGLPGIVTSVMLFDRRRGWMTDARTSVVARSIVALPPTPASAPSSSPPVRSSLSVEVRVTQHLWAMDKP